MSASTFPCRLPSEALPVDAEPPFLRMCGFTRERALRFAARLTRLCARTAFFFLTLCFFFAIGSKKREQTPSHERSRVYIVSCRFGALCITYSPLDRRPKAVYPRDRKST